MTRAQEDAEQALPFIAAAGADGVTARQIGARFEWPIGRRGSALMVLEAAGRVYARRRTMRNGWERVYVAWQWADPDREVGSPL